MMRTLSIPLLLALAPAVSATPPQLEDLALLDARIAVHLGGTPADAGLIAQPVDRRLRLLACAGGPQLAVVTGGTAIDASCPSKGWHLRLPLRKGAVTQTEIVVRRGDTVELTFAGDNFSVTTTATAVEDGSAGGVVRVKPPTGSATLTTRVAGPGAVSVGEANR